MSIPLLWEVLRHEDLPRRWKPLLAVLAFIARDDGSEIRVGLDKLSLFTGEHPVTVSRRLSEMAEAGIVPLVRRGGRSLTARGAVGRTTRRRLDVAALRRFGFSDAAKWSVRRGSSFSHVAKSKGSSFSHAAKQKDLPEDRPYVLTEDRATEVAARATNARAATMNTPKGESSREKKER